MDERGRLSISVTGVVQGVGFRPFVHAIANRLGLSGSVKNNSGGVLIDVEGHGAALESFMHQLRVAPPLAEIAEIGALSLKPRGTQGFRIEASEVEAGGEITVSADVATCESCTNEVFDSANRRFGYAFTNCTDCGPRYSIITSAPYDRARTTMAAFAMCESCQSEYDNPLDRRHHAQPIGCPSCGPRLVLLSAKGGECGSEDPIAKTANAIIRGEICAIKGIGGFSLACDANNENAVATLRSRKHRDDKPFALMVRDLADVKAICEMSALEQELLCSPAHPIVLLRRHLNARIVRSVAPDTRLLGVMLPYSPVHQLLLRQLDGRAVVMTSANRADEPIACRDDEIRAILGDIVDYSLTHDRAIQTRCDDSVVRAVDSKAMFVRRARGYAPKPIALTKAMTVPTLAVGAQLKSVIALATGANAYLSPHLGDIHHYESYRGFLSAIDQYETLFQISPQRVVHDLHPDYGSTRFALELAEVRGIGALAVQHHHAHIASCMADASLTEPCIGVAFDGGGYGTDGRIWGGEFFVGTPKEFVRAARLGYVALPGGERAVREPWRMAVSYMAYSGLNLSENEVSRRIPPNMLRTLQSMIERQINAPWTSSIGRLFDAVAALIGVSDRTSFEGQAAMSLESLADEITDHRAYEFALDETEIPMVIDARTVIRAIVRDARDGVARNVIARRFHNAIVAMVFTLCHKIRATTKISNVCLSGGVFMNAILRAECARVLRADGFDVFGHERVPPNDGGISLGQLAISAEQN